MCNANFLTHLVHIGELNLRHVCVTRVALISNQVDIPLYKFDQIKPQNRIGFCGKIRLYNWKKAKNSTENNRNQMMDLTKLEYANMPIQNV